MATHKKRKNEEFEHQCAFAEWLDLNGILFFHPANGGSRNVVEAVNLKKSGVKPGVPDIAIPVPSRGYHGLFIEMKKPQGGKLSAHQLVWLELLNNAGNLALVANGVDEAIAIVKGYLCL